jgi:hypothetical protein
MRYKILLEPKGLMPKKRSEMTEARIRESLHRVVSYRSRHFKSGYVLWDIDKVRWEIIAEGDADSREAIAAWGVMLVEELYNQLGMNLSSWSWVAEETADEMVELYGW